APDASWAFAITAFDGYLPVPMMRRDWNVLPAMRSVSVFITRQGFFLPAAHEVHNLDVIAFANERLIEGEALKDVQIVLDGNATGVDRQRFQQSCHSHRLRDVISIAV